MSRRKKADAYRAEVKRLARRKGASGESYSYTILGPHGPIVTGRFNGTKVEVDEHLGKTLKRFNSARPQIFHINQQKQAARAA